MTEAHLFWDRLADRYAARPIKDETAYEATLDRTRSHLHAEDRVLEVGCGTGTTALRLAPSVCHLTATDFSSRMIGIAREKAAAEGVSNVTFRRAGLAELGEAPYDALLAFNLLHLIEDVPAALEVLADRLKSGGRFISKTVCLGDGQRHLRLLVRLLGLVGKAPHVTFLGTAELERMIEAAGFRIVETGAYPHPRNHFVVAEKL